jgi:small subunit ribosomal protein S1
LTQKLFVREKLVGKNDDKIKIKEDILEEPDIEVEDTEKEAEKQVEISNSELKEIAQDQQEKIQEEVKQEDVISEEVSKEEKEIGKPEVVQSEIEETDSVEDKKVSEEAQIEIKETEGMENKEKTEDDQVEFEQPGDVDEVNEFPESEDMKSSQFEQLLEESLVNIKNLEIGDKVEGEIINITDSYIFVSLGGKRDAYTEKIDYLDKDGKLPFRVGDTLSGYVVKYTETETCIAKSLVSVSKRVLKEAFEEQIPVSGKVVSFTKGGFIINISGVRAFCPKSQMDLKRIQDVKQYQGKNYDFIIMEFKNNGRDIVASRRIILEVENEKIKKEIIDKLEIDSVIMGKVTRLTNFGAFIDLGGIEGLLHISQFSWARIDSPSEVLNIGDMIKAKVIKMSGEKISLSMKALQENPFDIALNELKVGDIINCRVLRNLPFGSFVEIKPGVEGLIPISELTMGRRITHPSEIVNEGEFIEAQIMKINPEERKISLSLKALQPDPWDDIDEIFTENDIVSGTIENSANFGIFIKLKEGLVGLMPSSKIKLAGIKLDKSNVGEEFNVRIVRIDKDNRRISLEPTNLPESVVEGKDDWHKYKSQKKKKKVIDEDSPFANL